MFTKLDLSHAYQQIVLDELSRELVTINTHRGYIHNAKDNLVVTSDASPYGPGAVLAHRYPDGTENLKSTAYASRTLSRTERKYSQIDKEALAIVWAGRKFYQYVAGRRFYIHTYHRPLIYLFSEKKGVPTMASGRIQRWALILGGYEVFHKSGHTIAHDGLSRLPTSKQSPRKFEPDDTVYVCNIQRGP